MDREPVWEEGTAGISIGKSYGGSRKNVVLAALLAILKLEAVRKSWVVLGRDQEVGIVTADTLKAGLGDIIDFFDEVSALLRARIEAGNGSWDLGSPT